MKDSEELDAWLRKQPREVSVAFAARAALRILPILQSARGRGFEGDFFAGIVLTVFRATGAAWVAAKYPARATEFSASAARAASAADAADADAGATAGATLDASYAYASAAAATYAATYAAGCAASTYAAADADAFIAAYAYAYASYAADANAFWSAVSRDATDAEQRASASAIAGLPLWPEDQPDQLRSLWQKMKTALHAAGRDWQVWTIWYDDRLAGDVRDEARELAYVRIENALWDQGPAVVNAEIKRRIDELEALQPVVVQAQARMSSATSMSAGVSLSVAEHEPPAPIENVPSAVSFGWSSKGTITVVLGELNWPAFPFKGGEQDHKHRLEACRALAIDIALSLHRQKWNARPDYADTLDHYVAYLSKHSEEGNFLLADAQARVIRAMFAAEVGILQVPLAAKLQVLLQQHIGLRAYYPATEDFYESVRSGHLETPLPIDAAEGFIRSVRDNTPTLFEPNVADTLENTAQPIPAISVNLEATQSDIARPAPPPDPLGEVDLAKSQRFTLASGINALWKVVSSGKKADENLEGWSKVIGTLGPYAAPILKWLRSSVLGS